MLKQYIHTLSRISRMMTDEEIVNIIENLAGLSEKSKKTYLTNIQTATRRTGAENISDLLLNPDKYVPILNQLDCPQSTLISYLTGIISVSKHIGYKESNREAYDGYYKAMLEAKQKETFRIESNEPTDRQKDGYIEWPELLKLRNMLKPGTVDHVIMSLYTYIPPRRVKDYAKLRVYQDPAFTPPRDHNYIHLNHAKEGAHMYLHEFKTVKDMKPYYTNELPRKLLETITLSMKWKPREYLFTQASLEPFKDEDSFGSFLIDRLKRLTKNPNFTINSFRHSFATYQGSRLDVSLRERSDNAIAMGHNFRTHLSYEFLSPYLNPLLHRPVAKEGVTSLCYVKDPQTNQMKAIDCLKLTAALKKKYGSKKTE